MTFNELDIPEGWNVFTVEQLIEEGIIEKPLDGNHGSIHPKSKDYVDDGIPFVMASDMENGGIDFIGCKKISLQQAKTLRKGFAKAGDVLLSHKATIGRTAILQTNSFEHVLLTPQVTYYRVIDFQKLNPVYLKTYFDSPKFQALFKLWSGDGSTRAYLGITAQQKLPIVLPPIDIQNNISSVIASFNEKINTNIAMNTTLEKIAQRLFKSWFVDFDPVKANEAGVPFDGLSPEIQALFPNELEESGLGMIPKGWEVKKLEQIGDIITGKTPSTKNEEYYGNEIPFITIPDMHGKSLVTESSKYLSKKGELSQPKKTLPKGSILVSCIATPGLVILAHENCQTNQQINSLLPYDKFSNFYFLSLKSMSGRSAFSHDGTVFDNMNKTSFSNLKMVIPSFDLLKNFNDLIEPIFEKVLINQKQVNTLAKIRDKLLPRLISGKITIQKAEELLEEAS